MHFQSSAWFSGHWISAIIPCIDPLKTAYEMASLFYKNIFIVFKDLAKKICGCF